MLSLKEMMTLMGIVTADPSLPMEKPKLVGVSPIQATCLAENVYFEARNQGTAGWSAVISVTLNRVKDKRFPNTVCEVVKQGPTRESWKKNGTYYPIKHRCHFRGIVMVRQIRYTKKINVSIKRYIILHMYL